MNLNDVYESVNFLTNKDQNGFTFSPKEFTLVVRLIQLGLYTEAIELLNQPKEGKNVDEFTVLSQLINSVTLATPFTLPSDFFHEDSLTSDGLDAEILSTSKYNSQVKNVFYEPSRTLAKIENKKVVCSNVPENIDLIYYRNPISPFYDWCTDVNGSVLYMEPGSWMHLVGTFSLVRATANWATATVYKKGDRVVYNWMAYELQNDITSSLIPSDNTDYKNVGLALIAANVQHLSNPTVDYYSQSIELDIPLFYYEKFIKLVFQYAMTNLGVKTQ